jgi:hypothetical protein
MLWKTANLILISIFDIKICYRIWRSESFEFFVRFIPSSILLCINVDKCSNNNKVLKEKYYVERIIIRKQDPKKVRIVCLYNTISSEDVIDTVQHSITNFDIKNRIQNKEWRDTRTFSNLKSTHCTLLVDC